MNFKQFNKPHSYHKGGRAQTSSLHMVKKGSLIIPPEHAESLLGNDVKTPAPVPGKVTPEAPQSDTTPNVLTKAAKGMFYGQ